MENGCEAGLVQAVPVNGTQVDPLKATRDSAISGGQLRGGALPAWFLAGGAAVAVGTAGIPLA
jgi:hypothetical protein